MSALRIAPVPTAVAAAATLAWLPAAGPTAAPAELVGAATPESSSLPCCPGPAEATADTASAQGGHLFIVGGGERPPDLMRRFVELAGGSDSARIVVIPMASSSPAETGRSHAAGLRELGADARPLVLDRERADAEDAARVVRRATGVWLPGGVQSRLADTLRSTAVLEAIEDAYRAGAAVGGTSAGAAVMSDSMITGEQFRADADTAGYYGDEFPRIARDYIVLEPGFGLLPGVVVDQHFLRRERHNRLFSVVLERPEILGVGIDESTALVVGPDGRWEVTGRSAALVVDARRAGVTPRDSQVLGAAGVRVHLLPAGASFEPSSGDARLPDGRGGGGG